MGKGLLEGVYRRNPSIVARNVEDEVVLVPIKSDVGDLDSIYTLNDVGAFIWELIDGKQTVGSILTKILDEFDVSEEQARADIEEFLANLEGIQAIERVK
jgi:hypothetical protein